MLPYQLYNFIYYWVTRLVAASMKRKKSEKKREKSREKQYIQHWSTNEPKKQYDALDDPHANYYFYNKSVNQHLRQLKKALADQRNWKQKQKLKLLINDKIKNNRLPQLKSSPKSALYLDDSHSQYLKLPQTRPQLELTSSSNKNRSVSRKSPGKIPFSIRQVQRYKSRDNLQIAQLMGRTRKTKQQVLKSNQEGHRSFMEFLASTKNRISSMACQQRSLQAAESRKQL